MTELKPCPFCGYNADLRIYYKDGQTQHYNGVSFGKIKKEYVIRCRKCNARMQCSTEKRTIEAWNRRADDENS